MELKWIDQYVDGVVDYCGSNNIFEIYSTFKIDIVKVPIGDQLLQGNDALYVRNYFGIEVVFIRDDFPYQFFKFILAHELGHAILHTENVKAAYNTNLIVKGKLEKQADYFALRLLNISIDKELYYGYTKEQLAKEFYVTEGSLEYCY